jgi:hypothetical protein
MKYCHACGQAIDDDTVFCPFCGTRQEPLPVDEPEAEPELGPEPYSNDDMDTEPEPESYQVDAYEEEESWSAPAAEPPKKKKKKGAPKNKKTALRLGLILGGVVILAAAVVLLFLTGSIGSLLPHSKAKLKLAEANLFKQVASVGNAELNQYKDFDFSYDLSMKAVNNSSRTYTSGSVTTADILNKMKLSGGIEGNGKGLKLHAAADYKSNELLDVLFFLDQDKVSLYMSPVSDDFYTCKIDDLLRLSGRESDDLPGTEKLADTDLAKKDLEKAVTVAFKDLFDSKIKISKGKTIQLFDDEKTVKGAAIYQISPTEKEWKKLMQDAFDAVSYKGSYLYRAVEYYLAMNKSSKDVDDYLDDLREEIPEIAENMADSELKIEVIMKGNTILRQRMYTEDGHMGYDAYRSGKETRFFVFYASNSSEEYTPVFDFQSTKSGRTYEFEATVGKGSDKVRFSGADVNPGKTSALGIPVGEYSFSVEKNRVELNVVPEGKGTNHELRIRFNQEYRYRSFDSFSLTLYTEKGASISKPKGVETVDISDYSDAEFQKLASKVGQKLYSVLQKVSN